MKRNLSVSVILLLCKFHFFLASVLLIVISLGTYVNVSEKRSSVFHVVLLLFAVLFMVYKVLQFRKVLHYLKYAIIKKSSRISFVKLNKNYFGLAWFKYQYKYTDHKNNEYIVTHMSASPWEKEYAGEKRILFLKDSPEKYVLLTHKYDRIIISISHVYIKRTQRVLK